jgi:hypothetical protein
MVCRRSIEANGIRRGPTSVDAAGTCVNARVIAGKAANLGPTESLFIVAEAFGLEERFAYGRVYAIFVR